MQAKLQEKMLRSMTRKDAPPVEKPFFQALKLAIQKDSAVLVKA